MKTRGKKFDEHTERSISPNQIVLSFGKTTVYPALPNGPSSPAPCDRMSTNFHRFEKAAGLLKMHPNHIFSL